MVLILRMLASIVKGVIAWINITMHERTQRLLLTLPAKKPQVSYNRLLNYPFQPLVNLIRHGIPICSINGI
jgi:hypothetical protein